MRTETRLKLGDQNLEATYRVRGLTCNMCLGAVMEELHALPGVDEFAVDLVPYGVSRVRIIPGDAATGEEVRRALGRRGFRLVAARLRAVKPTRAIDSTQGRRP